MRKCDNDAAYRFTWPGQDESVVCEQHSKKLIGIANAMGFYIQLKPLEESQYTVKCAQKLGEKESANDVNQKA